jgi:transcriptional regulator with XRE-family HTH domain
MEMDQKKVGMFLAQTRKQKGLTQKNLAERLMISDKTVSKWETGKSMVDPSLMIPLCEVLEISVNELLSGERLDASDYSRKAEENMIHLMKEKDQERKSRRKEIWMTVIGELLLVLLIALALLEIGGMQAFQYNIFDIIDFGFLLVADIILLLMTGLTKDFGRAIRCMFKGTEGASRKKVERALCAVRMISTGSLLMGVLIAVMVLLVMLYNLDDLYAFGPGVARALVSVGYGFFIAILLNAVRVRLELALQEMPVVSDFSVAETD